MKRTRSHFLAGTSLIVALALLPAHVLVEQARASTRPHYGGTLRVEMSARVGSLDPAEKPPEWPEADAKLRLLRLAFDSVVRLDENGQSRPTLVISWEASKDWKRWELKLRPNVKFHDGTPLAAADVVSAIAKWNESWKVSADGDSVIIVSSDALPNLPFELSLIFVARRAADGTILGTGPFKITMWQTNSRAVFNANEDYWEGRPFVDSIEVAMGRSQHDQLVDLELGKADLVELVPDQLRALAQSGKKMWSSVPVVFYELWFSSLGLPAGSLRDALSFAVDRVAMHNVLLQKQGEIAGGCLPQWLSGYAFLLSTERNLDEARKARGKLSSLPPMTLAYDSGDFLARAIADRVALDAREIGVTLQVKPQNAMEKDARPDVELFRRSILVPNPGLAIDQVCPSVRLRYAAFAPAETEAMYKAELASRGQEPYRIPLFYLPESFALSARVKNWMPYRWGEWRLADVWLVPDESAAPAKNVPEKP
jgi:peptide/nickel transport system substrate-binding protein